MAAEFDLSQPFKTRNGFEATCVKLDNRIMGVVQYDTSEAVFCVWNLDGKKLNLFPRKKSDIHDLDLLNVETPNESRKN